VTVARKNVRRPPMAGFSAVELRTTDVEAARRFYLAVLERPAAAIVSLEPQALARGARPHWLGYVEVPELDPGLAAFIERGATPLGPRRTTSEGRAAAVVRDPGGAVLALAETSSAGERTPDVVWYQLNTARVTEVKRCYQDSFGWFCLEPRALPALGLTNHPFAWRPGDEPVGAMADIADRPSVHPHWLFHFGVAALGPAIERVRAGAGTALSPVELPNGDRVAICDDPQGAAFALIERRV